MNASASRRARTTQPFVAQSWSDGTMRRPPKQGPGAHRHYRASGLVGAGDEIRAYAGIEMGLRFSCIDIGLMRHLRIEFQRHARSADADRKAGPFTSRSVLRRCRFWLADLVGVNLEWKITPGDSGGKPVVALLVRAALTATR